MNSSLKKCIDCGRLFSGIEGVQQCEKCAGDGDLLLERIEEAVRIDRLNKIPDIAQALGIDVTVVRRALSEMPLVAEHVESDATCSRCRLRPTKIGSEFCPLCMISVDADLRDMAVQVETDTRSRANRPESRMRQISVSEALHEKQRRTGNYRFRPTIPNVKGYS